MQDLMLLNKEISSCFLFAQEKNAHRVKKSLWQCDSGESRTQGQELQAPSGWGKETAMRSGVGFGMAQAMWW